jgi:uncharacterized protein YecT (DUF1311 family)
VTPASDDARRHPVAGLLSRCRALALAIALGGGVSVTATAQDSTGYVRECEGAETTAGIRRCLNEARERVSREIALIFEDARARANQPATLDSAQRVWEEFRQAQCVAESDQFDGGSLQPVVFLSCWHDLTRRRIRYLEQLFREP